METKLCKRCGEMKSTDAFNTIKSGSRTGKLHTYCRKCLTKQVGEWRTKNPIRSLENQRRWLKENPDRKLRYGMRRYGVDEEWFKAKLAEQNGTCALCEKTEDAKPGSRGRLSVDHDHATGANRGLLCNTCNMRLAGLESQHWFQRAQAYLRQYP
jgi:hypothetical protein